MRKSRLHLLLSFILLVFFGCEYNDIPREENTVLDCAKSLLAVTVTTKKNATTCNSIDGSIEVAGSGGVAPYAYSINGGTFQTNPLFPSLAPGIYTIQVIDEKKCIRSIDVVDIISNDSDLSATLFVEPDHDCLTGNGSFSVTPFGGSPPYTYQFGNGDFVDKATFDALTQNLPHGFYPIAVQDDSDCLPKSINVVVPRTFTGVSFESVIKPIIDTNCAKSGCHNGDNGPTRNWNILELIQKNAQNIKTRTGNKSMPLGGHLTDEEIKLIACWVDDGARDN